MRKQLTDRYIKGLKAPKSGRLVIADIEVRGLSLRVTDRGVKSWLIRYRVKGETEHDAKGRPKQRVEVFGAFPGKSLSDARQRARAIITAAKDGIDLVAQETRQEAAQRAAAKAARTVRDLAAEYVEKHCKPHQRRWIDTQRRLDNHVVPALGDRAVSDIRRADIVELLDTMEHGNGLRQQVNRTRTTLAGMFRYAIERQLATDNPVTGTRYRKLETERARVLDDDEIKTLWTALEKLHDPGRAFVKALFYTGARRDEVRGMRWAEISADGAVWTLPAARNKSGRDHEVPLSEPLQEILAALPRLGPFVFTMSGEKAWHAHDRLKEALDRTATIAAWRYHDIRRSVRSRLAELRIPYEIAERVLGHVAGKVERPREIRGVVDGAICSGKSWRNPVGGRE